MKELFVRSISGIVYSAVVIISMFASREWFMGLFFVLAVITLSEFLKLVHLTSYLAYLLLAAALYFLSYDIFDTNAVYLYLILTGFVNLFLVKDILWVNKIPMFEKKKYITVIFYLISGFVFITLIPFREGEFMPLIIVGLFLLVWANDSFAYLVGKNLGKRKLLERISPKKTVEGFLGGLAGSLLASFIIFKYTETYPLGIWIGLALLVTVFGTTGDLIQSKFKRQAGVKDSGVLMPGHGGLYDRLDSIVYISPFAYAFLEIVNYVS
ncbi:MAG: phosphatidate cytidylyltransferase [Flavobacteriales bacterium]|jgi:phosphatidate cytidylyltransferase|uniref:phosphatidate cytidylyltransferase n=1 Tax=Candidatus Ulvibacter alkanivorans TaxID=2267620 RepID=UPI000DF3959D|nr:phosphatidate cytidylyltransferase [Candidatus Ulvibacter alkanivorans]MCH2489563.1 phosphatidate cytidylyltransferase [Flavobacteriales bacterium]